MIVKDASGIRTRFTFFYKAVDDNRAPMVVYSH